MKFETYANKILIDHKLKFLKDPCTHKCAPSLRLVRAYSHTDLPEILVGGQSVFYIWIGFKFHFDILLRRYCTFCNHENSEDKKFRVFTSWIITKSKKSILTFWDTIWSHILTYQGQGQINAKNGMKFR